MAADNARREDPSAGGAGNEADPLLPHWRELARRMVAHIEVEDPRIAQALREVPRHRFLEAPWREQAYQDTPLPVGPDATISAPHMVALQLESALLAPGQRVMELGSGCGYLLALLDRLVAPDGKVCGVEIEPDLAELSRANLRRVGASGAVSVHEGDGAEGWEDEGPFDRILVSYAVEGVLPPSWREQLREGGYLVVPWGRGEATYLERLRRTGGELQRDLRGPLCLFVPSKSGALRARPPRKV